MFFYQKVSSSGRFSGLYPVNSAENSFTMHFAVFNFALVLVAVLLCWRALLGTRCIHLDLCSPLLRGGCL